MIDDEDKAALFALDQLLVGAKRGEVPDADKHHAIIRDRFLEYIAYDNSNDNRTILLFIFMLMTGAIIAGALFGGDPDLMGLIVKRMMGAEE